MKRVLFIGMTPNQGGMETFMINTFMELKDKGFKFEFVNTSNKKIAYSNLIYHNNGVIRNVPINNSWITHLRRYNIAYNFFKKHHNYDIVHLNTLSINLIFWLKAAQKFGIQKLIIHSHNDQINYTSKLRHYFGSLLAVKNRKYLNNNSNIIELSASNSSGYWMFHNSNFVVINNGIDSNKFLFSESKKKYLKDKLFINYSDKVLITVARIDYQKNYEKIINIFKIINNKIPNTKLVIIGNGPEYNNIFNLVKKLKLNNNVIFMGMINNVNEMLNIADLMLMPSRYEGFPFALIESQSSGVPALVSSEGIPKSSNVTGHLKYLSLKKSDDIWANVAISILEKSYNNKMKFQMNNIIGNSKYSIDSSIQQIKKIYLK